MPLNRIAAAFALTLAGLSIGSARADEKKIPIDQAPKPVIAAFAKKFPKATIKTVIEETEDGKTMYEVESMVGKMSIDAVLMANGDFVETEEQVAVADLPSAVSDAIKAKYPKAEMEKAEKVTKDGKMTYEVLVEVSDDNSVEMAVEASGKVVSEKKAAAEEKKD